MSILAQLHGAIKELKYDVVTDLLKEGANVNVLYCRETAFSLAADMKNYPLMKIIIMNFNFDPTIGNQFDRTPLYFAAIIGDVNLLQTLIDICAKVDCRDVTGVTPLSATAWHDHVEAAKLLLDSGADINQADNSGTTPLIRACGNVSLEIVKLLLCRGCDVNAKTNEAHNHVDLTALMAAIPSHYEMEVRGRKMSTMIHIMKLLISSGCDVNAVDGRNNTALHLSILHNQTYAVCLLADSGADIDKPGTESLSPLRLALREQRYEVAKCLILYGCRLDWRNVSKVTGNIESPMTMVLSKQPHALCDRIERNKALRLILLGTVCNCHFNADITLCLNDKSGELDEAESELLKSFLMHNSPPSLISTSRTIIRRVLGQNLMQKLDKLRLAWPLRTCLSLDYNYRFSNPLTVCEFHIALSESNTDAVQDLLNRNTDVYATYLCKLPLNTAVSSSAISSIVALLAIGANPAISDPSGECNVHMAARLGRVDILEVLLPFTDEVNSFNSEGETPMLVAAKAGNFETVEFLIGRKCDVDVMGHSRFSELHYAAGSGNVKTVTMLLAAGASPDLQDCLGNTPLHLATSRGEIYKKHNISLPSLYRDEPVDYASVAELLVQAGTDKNVRNADSQTALDVAVWHGSRDHSMDWYKDDNY